MTLVTGLHSGLCLMVPNSFWNVLVTIWPLNFTRTIEIFISVFPCPSSGPLKPYSAPLYQNMSVLFHEEGRRTTCWNMSCGVTFLVESAVDHCMFSEQLIFFCVPLSFIWALKHPLTSFVSKYSVFLLLVFMKSVTGLYAGLCPMVSNSQWSDQLIFYVAIWTAILSQTSI